MAESNNTPQPANPAPQGASPNGAEAPLEGRPVLPQALVEAQQRLESLSPELQFKGFDDRLEVTVPVEKLLDTAMACKNDLGYRLLMSQTAVDWKDRFELVYHLYRLDSAFPIVLRCDLPREESPEVASLTPFWPGAEFQEREIYDLMGIVFAGHPDLRRILLSDDFQGHPLRKDWEQDPAYVLVPHLRVPGYAGAKRGDASTGRFLDE